MAILAWLLLTMESRPGTVPAQRPSVVPGELGPAVAAEGLPVGLGALLGEALLGPGDLAYGFLAALDVDVADHDGLTGGVLDFGGVVVGYGVLAVVDGGLMRRSWLGLLSAVIWGVPNNGAVEDGARGLNG